MAIVKGSDEASLLKLLELYSNDGFIKESVGVIKLLFNRFNNTVGEKADMDQIHPLIVECSCKLIAKHGLQAFKSEYGNDPQPGIAMLFELIRMNVEGFDI